MPHTEAVGQESLRQWRKTDWSRENPGACKEAQRRPRERQTKTSGRFDRRASRPVEPSGVEHPPPEMLEDPNERAKLKRQAMPTF